MKKNTIKLNESQIREIIAESIADYFKLDGNYYGSDPNIGLKNGWFVYLFKDGMTEEPVAEITKANIKNFGAHHYSLNGFPKKFFKRYEDAVLWCQSKGIKEIQTRDEQGHLRVDYPEPKWSSKPNIWNDSSFYLQESELRRIISESVKMVMKEIYS